VFVNRRADGHVAAEALQPLKELVGYRDFRFGLARRIGRNQPLF
jgi:hypothetical protein